MPTDTAAVRHGEELNVDSLSAFLTGKLPGVDSGIAVEFKAKYPDWPNMNVAGFVRSIYVE